MRPMKSSRSRANACDMTGKEALRLRVLRALKMKNGERKQRLGGDGGGKQRRGAKVVKAFSPKQVYCDSSFFQEHTVPGSCWIDLGFEWIAREVATVATTWPFLAMAVTVDGDEIGNPKQQSKGPDKAVLPCANGTRIGYVMANALYIPPLPLGDHTIIWTISFARDIDDGWNTYPRGKELVVTSLLHVVKAV
jgi:hypothetical protein